MLEKTDYKWKQEGKEGTALCFCFSRWAFFDVFVGNLI